MNPKKIKINSAQSSQRTDKFLAGFYVKKSRASWQKKIKSEKVLINKKRVKPDYILKEGDEVEILSISQLPIATPYLKIGKIEIPQIEIIYEDDNVIVIDKPAGVLSQNAESSESPSVADFLVKYLPKIREIGQDEQRFGAVHRLDKDTSGVMVVAKNNNSFEFLKDQFKNRKTQKTYTTLVYGIISPKEGMINLKIGRSKTNPLMQTVINTKKKEAIKSREAVTVYKTIKTLKNYSLLEGSPKTGRMHQIRVHLKALGYPVVGDKKYFFRKYSKIEPKINRQFLHASKLEISLPNNTKTNFKSKLPKDLKKFLDKISMQ